MPVLASRRQTLAFLAALAAVAFFVHGWRSPSEQRERVYVFVLDARADKTLPLDTASLATEINDRQSRTRITVRTFASTQLIDSEAAIERAVEDRQRQRPASAATSCEDKIDTKKTEIPTSELFFIELDPPYSQTKKALRRRFDE